MIETFKNAFKIKEVRNKILFTLLFVVLYRLGCFIPVPGLNFSSIAGQFEQANIFNLLNSVTGSALSQGTIFAIGISPYINASIIIQLLTVAIPSLERMSKEGEEGKAKIEKITRWVTLALAIISAVGILFAFQNAASGQSGSIIDPNFFGEWLSNVDWLVFVYASIVLVGGSMLCMWIGERITEYGISNGISVLIFVGILSTAFNGIFKTIGEIPTNISRLWELLGFLATSLLVFAFIVWVNGAERKIKVQYAKQVKGNKMYGGQSTFIPIKVNASGVMPLIFAFAILSFPSMLIETFWKGSDFGIWWAQYMGNGTIVYTIVLAILIFVFSYFYSQIQFNPLEISKNIQQNGGFIPGIRPGRETSEYLSKVVSRITFWGAVFLAIIALIPSLIFGLVTSNNSYLITAFSATGMLIVVSVALEFDQALENQIMMRHYKGFLK